MLFLLYPSKFLFKFFNMHFHKDFYFAVSRPSIIYAIVVFLSYMLSGIFPKPIYGNAYLRLILFSAITIMFRRWVSTLYRRVLDYWHIYILPAVSLLACLLSYFFSGDIERDRTGITFRNETGLLLHGLRRY